MAGALAVSESKFALYRKQADRLIARFDRNGDAAIDAQEANERVAGTRTYNDVHSKNNQRFSYLVTNRDHISISSDAMKAADADGDGKITADEAARKYAAIQDADGNGSLSLWESFKSKLRDWFTSGAYGHFARHRTEELSRQLVGIQDEPRPPQHPYESTTPTPRQPSAKEVDGMLHDLDTNGDGHINKADNRWYKPIMNSARRDLAESGVHDLSVAEASKKAREKLGASR